MSRIKKNSKLSKFYAYKIKPRLLSIKHFFKSSHKYFKMHPRLRNTSIVLGILVLVVASSAIMNTFSRGKYSYNIDNKDYDAYADEFWTDMAPERTVTSLSYKTISDSSSCDINVNNLGFVHGLNCTLNGSGTAGDPYQISSVQEFMYVRNAGFNVTTGKYYVLTNNLDFTGVTLNSYSSTGTTGYFAGILDGDFKHIKGLTFGGTGSNFTTNGLIPAIMGTSSVPAMVKNFILDDSTYNISGGQGSGTLVFGSMVGTVGPYSYAYNNGLLSGNISLNAVSNVTYAGTMYGYYNYSNTYSGSSVGNTKSGIINSYSYANLTLSGNMGNGSKFGGILGYRRSLNGKMSGQDQLIFENNYYGKINASGNCDYQFVYNGVVVEASRSPHYSYYWYKGGTRDITTNSNSYAIAQDSEYLQSEGFVANLNTYDDILDYYFKDAWGSSNVYAAIMSNDIKITEWYISRTDFASGRPYFPIIRYNQAKEKSTNYDGSIEVYFDAKSHGSNRSQRMNITNQDVTIDDYVYHKLELPYALETIGMKEYSQYGNAYAFNGWRLVSVTANGTTYTTPGSLEGMNYNYGLRKTGPAYTKNIQEVYAEGGYYLVPEGVTSVRFEAVWARAFYVADNYLQEVFTIGNYQLSGSDSFGSKTNGSGNSPSSPYNSLSNAYNALSNAGISDQYGAVIILVSNVHWIPDQQSQTTTNCNWLNTGTGRPVTIKSIDNNNDHKPDYSLFVRNLSYMTMGTIRFDFINLLGVPQVGGYSGMLGTFAMSDGAHFVTTETVVSDHIKLLSRKSSEIRVLGGYIDVYGDVDNVLGTHEGVGTIIFGGTARANVVTAGSELLESNAGSNEATITVVNIIGGRAGFVSTDYSFLNHWNYNTYIYVDGGYIDTFYSVYYGFTLRKTYSYINNAYINTCFGGGGKDTSYSSDGLQVTIDNSRIGTVVGGPEFGRIGGAYTFTITNSEMDYVYGGGGGGTYYIDSSSALGGGATKDRTAASYGTNFSLSVNYANNIQSSLYVNTATGGDNYYFPAVNYTAKLYSHNGQVYSNVRYILAYFSVASVPTVDFDITDSKINHDIYAGGKKGLVEKDVHFNLHNVEVHGSIYGAGYSDEEEYVYVYDNYGNQPVPTFINYAIDSEYTPTNLTRYTWTNSGSGINNGAHTVTSRQYGSSGDVRGSDIFLNITGDNDGKYTSHIYGDVYGGGNMANVTLTKNGGRGTIHVNIGDGVTIEGNVYGGGNLKDVSANTAVYVENYDTNLPTTINGSVYAAGNNANVLGAATVTIAGNPTINNVFGGGNKSSANESNVYIEGGHIAHVYGGSDNSGQIGTSHVYIGKHNPAEVDGGEVEKYDFCNAKAIQIGYSSYNGNPAYAFTNNSNISFKNYTISITYANASSVQTVDDWGGNHQLSYSSGVLTMNQNLGWGGAPDHLWNAYSTEYFQVHINSGSPNPGNYPIASITIEAYDSNNNRYFFDNCSIDKYTNIGTNHVTFAGDKSVTHHTKMSNIIVDNVYGGNNAGGKTANTNVLVLGDGTFTDVDANNRTYPYTVTVGNVYGGGNSTTTGNSSSNTARVVLNNAHATGNVFAGSSGDIEDVANAKDATMLATPYVLIANGSVVDGSVFGGGYASDAPVGTESNHINTNVYLDNCTIGENVYGGGYGDVVYGSTNVYPTLTTTLNTTVTNIFGLNSTSSIFYGIPLTSNGHVGYTTIHGTIFGGSETGAKNGGYDYKTKSVMDGINIYIEDIGNKAYLTLDGSIFGSGNYSSAAGTSNIYIKNWGTRNYPKFMKSIQRADNVYLDNAAIVLSGASDVTNKFNKVKYSFNNIKRLVLGNASAIFTSAQANLLENFYSINGAINYNAPMGTNPGTLSSVTYTPGNTITVDDDTKEIINSINGSTGSNNMNRLYINNNKGFNILKSEEIGDAFGNVYGMTFLGVYTENNGTINTTYYNQNYDLGRMSASGMTDAKFSGYVLGGNRVVNDVAMDYHQHGFYTNTYYDNDGQSSPRIYSTIINPTPDNQAYYYWNIGVPSIIMEVDLTASKYVRSGMKSVSLYQFSGYRNITFDIANIDTSSLKPGVEFMNPSAIPTIAETDEDAISKFGLSFETSESGWINEGHTYFNSVENGNTRNDSIEGTVKYDTSGTEAIPKFIVNIENSRNVKENIDLGTVVVTINAHAFDGDDMTNAINSSIKLYINLDTAFYEDDDYESSIAPGKHFKSFLTTKTNITTTSSFSTYFNMYAFGKNIYENARTNYPDTTIDHVLYSSYRLPAGTRLTMLDVSTNDPKYYYYDIAGTETILSQQGRKYNDDVTTFYAYPLSLFIAMDSTDGTNTYDESYNQSRYVIPDGDGVSTIEQFIFMVDFSNVSGHTGTLPITGEEFYLGLRATENSTGNFTLFSYPMSETMRDMTFSIYDASDASFDLALSNTPTMDDTLYVDDIFDFNADITVNERVISDEENGNLIVRNTSYYQDRLGLRIGLYRVTTDTNNNEIYTLVTGNELTGAIFYVDGVGYAPGSNGFIRCKLADYVVNLSKAVQVDLSNATNLTSGLYEFRVTAFASSDGLYAKQGDTITNSNGVFRVNLVNENYGLLSTVNNDADVIVNSNGKTSGGHDTIDITLNYFGSYTNPNIRVSLKRRDYTSVSSYTYNDVNIADIFDTVNITFDDRGQPGVTDLFDNSTLTISKDALLNHINSGNMGTYNMSFKLKTSATNYTTGTYRLVFTLYNGTREIGDVYSYFIVKD